jgi:glycosyltransferase involved in cell wall biosynthesis
MRIGFDAKRAFFNNTGLGNYSRNTIRQLLQYFPENEYRLFVPSKKIRIPFSHEPAGCVYPDSFMGKIFPSYWRSFLINSQIYKEKLTVYHGLSNELPFGMARHTCKKIVTIHDLIFLRYPNLYKGTDRKIYLKKFTYAAHTADVVIAVSEQTKRDIAEMLNVPGEKIKVVYQGCNSVFFEACPQELLQKAISSYQLPEDFILYVGTIEERKNLLSLVKAMHEFKIDMPLVAIGRKTEYFTKIEEYIASSGEELKKKIIFIDNLPNEMLRAFYKLARLFVYPSVFEGFGIPILEALASGTPVVTSTGSCFAEAGGKGALYADPASPAEIAEMINTALYNEDARNNLIAGAREHSARFSDEKVAQELMKVYT